MTITTSPMLKTLLNGHALGMWKMSPRNARWASWAMFEFSNCPSVATGRPAFCHADALAGMTPPLAKIATALLPAPAAMSSAPGMCRLSQRNANDAAYVPRWTISTTVSDRIGRRIWKISVWTMIAVQMTQMWLSSSCASRIRRPPRNFTLRIPSVVATTTITPAPSRSARAARGPSAGGPDAGTGFRRGHPGGTPRAAGP